LNVKGFDNDIKQDKCNQMSPKLSIITITYNAETVLERTLQSIANQTVRDFEYLIIDGNSRDGTLELIDKYANIVSRVVSEKDKGIYDAMNKGLSLATGQYVWFMNAGDEIHDPQVIARLYEQLSQQADVYYGETLFVNDSGKSIGLRSEVTPHILPQNLSWHDFKLGMVVCHQAFIARRAIAPLYLLTHFYSADIDWEIRCLKQSTKVINLNIIVAKYLMGGFSVKNLRKSWTDRFVILARHFGFVGAIWSHVLIAIRGVKFILKKGKYW
jgi:glycosyltransferase involved in cell wall biosynthesis